MSETTSKKRKLSLPLIVAGGVSSLVLALGMSPTFSAFTASITNSVNTAGTGALIMTEVNTATGGKTCVSTDGGSISTNSATCATINKYGGNLVMIPGQAVTTNITIQNTGSVAASAFTLAPGACAQSNNGTVNGTATDLCSKMTVDITSGTTNIWSGTMDAFTQGGTIDLMVKLGLGSIAGNSAAIPFTFVVTLPSTGNDNAYQGLQVSQPMTWNFQS